MVTAEVYDSSGGAIASWSREFGITPGNTILKVPLFSNASGKLIEFVDVSLYNRTVWKGNFTYYVSSPPRLLEVSYKPISPTKVVFKVVISSDDDNVPISLRYVISSKDSVIYNNTLDQVLNRGMNEFLITVELPSEGRFLYNFTLEWSGGYAHSSGSFHVSSNKSGTSLSTEVPDENRYYTSSQSSGTGDRNRVAFLVMLLIFLALVGLGAYYYLYGYQRSEKRTRPKPKRRSPLGRFRRPKRPEFKENRELPKKR
jgi:hypothetical protein